MMVIVYNHMMVGSSGGSIGYSCDTHVGLDDKRSV